MFSHSTFMRDVYLLQKGLGVESMRRKVIADNIANANVPHFKRSEVNFETQLRQVLAQNKEKKVDFYQTHQRHIPLFENKDYRSVNPRINLDYTTGYHNNGNNVDPDKEITLAAKNQLRYVTFIQQSDQYFRMLNGAMRAPA